MLIVTGIIVVFFVFTRSCGIGSIDVAEQEPRNSDISSDVDEIERLLRETPADTGAETSSAPRMPVYNGDADTPLVISHGTPRSEARTETRETVPLEPEAVSRSVPAEDANQPAGSEAVSEEENVELKASLTEEKKLTDQFKTTLAEELRSNMTAIQVRAKAYQIREEASAIRDNAYKMDPELKSAMLERAKVMEDYATRLSATRGNARKIRILIHELSQQ